MLWCASNRAPFRVEELSAGTTMNAIFLMTKIRRPPMWAPPAILRTVRSLQQECRKGIACLALFPGFFFPTTRGILHNIWYWSIRS
jgi:hypothetical protein